MDTLAIAVLSFFSFIVAYNTYGRWLGRKIFQLDDSAPVPSHQLNDGVDFVPTRRSVVFGHHFTSIAGTGPIVGPAIAVFWGWLPALLWVLVGSIFIGAVHDFGSLVVSMRNRGQTIGEVAGRMISKRARILFLLVLFFALTVILAIFGLVIASIFSFYPQSVFSVWVAMPLAVAIGFWMRRHTGSIAVPSVAALLLLYAAVAAGVYLWPITLPSPDAAAGADLSYWQQMASPLVVWTAILFVYCFIASVLPVWTLLQPRDYINSLQLYVALVLIVGGLLVAHPTLVAPAWNASPPADAPPMFPFLFITIACGAISGFHCLVSSGTSSKQIRRESDARYIGYGAMLLEGALAVLVILACCAGLGMGIFTSEGTVITPITGADGAPLLGADAWQYVYGGAWAEMNLAALVGAFVEGSANMIAAVGVPLPLAIGIIAVMVACFAATTLDSATRLQRYVIQELGADLGIPGLNNRFVATSVAVGTAAVIALVPGPGGAPGTGGLLLWPMFGATNQLLAGLAFMVIAFYLVRHGKPVWFLALPALMMLVMPAWALILSLIGWFEDGNWLLFGVGLLIQCLQIWIVVEGALMWQRAQGVLPEPLPPLPEQAATAGPDAGRVC